MRVPTADHVFASYTIDGGCCRGPIFGHPDADAIAEVFIIDKGCREGSMGIGNSSKAGSQAHESKCGMHAGGYQRSCVFQGFLGMSYINRMGQEDKKCTVW